MRRDPLEEALLFMFVMTVACVCFVLATEALSKFLR